MSNNNYYYLLTNLLTEDERRVITSIVQHIQQGAGRVGIQQIADENFVSTAFIMRLCKRLGFNGYSELFYYLLHSSGAQEQELPTQALQNLIANFDEGSVARFCELLAACREKKIFVIGEGFGDLIAEYIAERLAVCGFMVFNRVHFYDLMLFAEGESGQVIPNVSPAMIIAISQSGETESVLDNVRQAREKGFTVASFSRRPESTLASLSDLLFVINPVKQTLISEIPNSFFGKVVLAFEELLGAYFKKRAS